MIVYILGAGASHDTLPIVKDFPERLRRRAETMHERTRFLDDSMQLLSGRKPTQVLEDFTNNLKWLASQSSNHLSVDTFAKKLYVSGKEEDLLKMKATLACFLWIEQVLRPTQMRYDGFFAALIELKGNEVTLPNQVKIITWNYDSQIERAFYPYWGRATGLYDALQAYPVNNQRPDNIDVAKFCIVRLNGLAGLHLSEDDKISRPFNLFSILSQEEAMDPLVNMFDRYLTTPEKAYPLLNFAWDNNYYSQKFTKVALEVAATASELVIIGYSFPFFNRHIDRSILGAMSKLEKVYLQVPSEDFPAIRDRMLSARPDLKSIVHIDDLHQFYLPNNL